MHRLHLSRQKHSGEGIVKKGIEQLCKFIEEHKGKFTPHSQIISLAVYSIIQYLIFGASCIWNELLVERNNANSTSNDNIGGNGSF